MKPIWIDPKAVADELVALMDPIAALETSNGITALDADMSPDEEAVQTLLRG